MSTSNVLINDPLSRLFLKDIYYDDKLNSYNIDILKKRLYTLSEYIIEYGRESMHCNVLINQHALLNALMRYSKDVYGLSRIEGYLTSKLNTINVSDVKSFADFAKKNSGLMLETSNPHLNKQIAYLSYHLAILKPFSTNHTVIDTEKIKDEKYRRHILTYCNEIIIVFLVREILTEYKANSIIFSKKYSLLHFIKSLSVRNLTRSSLELLFENTIIPIKN